MPPLRFLITGATGNQGGACIRALLVASGNSEIYAVTRKANSPSAQKLALRGVYIIEGDLDNPEAIFAKIDKPLDGVFSVQPPIKGSQTVEREERQGKALFDAAQKAGVKHFVYSSVARDGFQPTPVLMFANKHRIEEHIIQTARISWTILQPTSFMDNLAPRGFQARFYFTAFDTYVGHDTPLDHIATEDIGNIAATILMNPEPHKGKSYPLSGDRLTLPEMQRIYSRISKENSALTFHLLVRFVFKVVLRDVGQMYKWFGVTLKKFRPDALESTKQLYPGVMNFETWAERNLAPHE